MPESRHIHVKIVDEFDKNSDLRFWLGKKTNERIEAVEFLRSQYYVLSGYKSIPRFIPNLQIRTLRN